jgi:HSP20 family molecular chaperone IbpA
MNNLKNFNTDLFKMFNSAFETEFWNNHFKSFVEDKIDLQELTGNKITCEVPGFTKEEIKINIKNRILTVIAKNENKNKTFNIFINDKKVKSTKLDLGILTIEFESVENNNEIEIKID